jgi:hypothetical protein
MAIETVPQERLLSAAALAQARVIAMEIVEMATTIQRLAVASVDNAADDEEALPALAARDLAGQVSWLAGLLHDKIGGTPTIANPEACMLPPAYHDAAGASHG